MPKKWTRETLLDNDRISKASYNYSISRQVGQPLDYSSLFDTEEQLDEYINSSDDAYVGQICTVTGSNKAYLVGENGKVPLGGGLTFKCKHLSSGEKFQIKAGTMTIVHGSNYKQYVTNSSGTTLKDYDNKTFPAFGSGLIVATTFTSGTTFRCEFVLTTSLTSGASVTNRNHEVTNNNCYIKAGDTTWVFYTEADDNTQSDVLRTISLYSGTTNTIYLNGNSGQGGAIDLNTSSGQTVIDMWAKDNDDARIIVRNNYEDEWTEVNCSEVLIRKNTGTRKLSDVLSWGYKIKVVSSKPTNGDADTIYIITG